MAESANKSSYVRNVLFVIACVAGVSGGGRGKGGGEGEEGRGRGGGRREGKGEEGRGGGKRGGRKGEGTPARKTHVFGFPPILIQLQNCQKTTNQRLAGFTSLNNNIIIT